MNDPKEKAKTQLAAFKSELKSLAIADYHGKNVVDYIVDGKEFTSTEWEMEDAYTDPSRAIYLLIECAQLELEAQGLPRKKIITTDRAAEIIRRNIITGDNTTTIRMISLNTPDVISAPEKKIVGPMIETQPPDNFELKIV